MKSIKRVSLLVVLAVLMCLSFAMVGLSTNTASADTLEPTTFEMDEGTSAKLSKVAGLRFRVKVDTETKDKIINEDNTTLTFVITPKVFITCVEDYKTVAQKITMSADEGMFYQEDEESDIWYANCVITKIKEANYKLDYSCVAYINDGETTTYTTNFAYNNLYATLNSATLDIERNYAKEIFSRGLYNWFGTEENPIVVENQEQYNIAKGKEFNGKENAYIHVPVDAVTNGEYGHIVKSYMITFKDYDGSILKKISVKVGGKLSSLPMVVTSKTGKKIYGYKDTNSTYFTTDTEINSDIELTAQIMSVGLSYTLTNNNTAYSVTGIGTCTDTEIIIPETYNGLPVTSIGGSAFYNCSSLTSIEISESVKWIGSQAFAACSSLKSVEMGDGVTSIGMFVFVNCSLLSDVKLSKKLTEIPQGTFMSCISLRSIFIPSSVTDFGSKVFYDSGLKSITFGDTTNWYLTSEYSFYLNRRGGMKANVSNSTMTCRYFTVEYSSSYWYKN